MRSATSALLGVLLVSLAGCRHARPMHVELRGRVLERTVGVPVPHVLVVASQMKRRTSAMQVMASFERIGETHTDSEGRFRLRVSAERTLGVGVCVCGLLMDQLRMIERSEYAAGAIGEITMTVDLAGCPEHPTMPSTERAPRNAACAADEVGSPR